MFLKSFLFFFFKKGVLSRAQNKKAVYFQKVMMLCMETLFCFIMELINADLSFPIVSCPSASPRCADPGARAAYGQRAPCPSD